MSTFIAVLLLAAGFGFLIKGADFLVDGASALAKRFRVREIVIGLTVVAFGTSAPELVVNVFASLRHQNDIALGNILGSNIFNILVILGLSGLFAPIAVQKNTVWKEIPIAFAAIIALPLCALIPSGLRDGMLTLGPIGGIILLAGFSGFLYYIYRSAKSDPTPGDPIADMPLMKSLAWIILGFGLLFFGGNMVVDNAVLIARSLGIGEKLIALTIVSAGTSLPELATSIAAARKKRNDLAIGNVVGSNIFNVLLIIGTSAVISPISFGSSYIVDFTVAVGATVLLFTAMFTGKRRMLDRWEAGILLAGYGVYLTWLILRG